MTNFCIYSMCFKHTLRKLYQQRPSSSLSVMSNLDLTNSSGSFTLTNDLDKSWYHEGNGSGIDELHIRFSCWVVKQDRFDVVLDLLKNLVQVLVVSCMDLMLFVDVVGDVINVGSWCFEDNSHVKRDLEWFAFFLVDCVYGSRWNNTQQWVSQKPALNIFSKKNMR